jgi:hypothetical protein
MKRLAFIVLVCLGCAGCGTAPCDFSRQDAFNTISNEVKVLREIDTICGDTWCCGDWDFKFDDAGVNGDCWQNVIVRTFINRSYDWDGGKLMIVRTNAGAWSAVVQSSTLPNLPWMVNTTVYNDDSIKNCKMSQKLYDCLTESFDWAEAQYEGGGK